MFFTNSKIRHRKWSLGARRGAGAVSRIKKTRNDGAQGIKDSQRRSVLYFNAGA